jgi:hypothetical protein
MAGDFALVACLLHGDPALIFLNLLNIKKNISIASQVWRELGQIMALIERKLLRRAWVEG